MNNNTTTIGKKTIETKNISKIYIDQTINNMKKEGLTEEKNYRKMINKIIAIDDQLTEDREQKEVKKMTITVEWKKSRMWGNCPHANINVEYIDGRHEQFKTSVASGCGYCKESTVIAEAFNMTLKSKLYKIQDELVKSNKWSSKGYTDGREVGLPYGMIFSMYGSHFGGGIGVSCYYSITEALQGKFENTANGSNFGVYTVTF